MLVIRAVVLIIVLKLALILGDFSEHVEACSGMTNVAPDRVNVDVNLAENS